MTTQNSQFKDLFLGTVAIAKYWNQPLSEIDNLSVSEYALLLEQTQDELRQQENSSKRGGNSRLRKL